MQKTINAVSDVIHDNAQSKHCSSNIVVYCTLITQLLISRNKTFSIYVVYPRAQLLHLIGTGCKDHLLTEGYQMTPVEAGLVKMHHL